MLNRNEVPLKGSEIINISEIVLNSDSFKECSLDYCNQLREFIKSIADGVDKTREMYSLNDRNKIVPEGYLLI